MVGLKLNKIKRLFFIIMGTFFLCLGTIGIFIPILPTTPFLLLSAACYYKGSEKLHNWILNNRFFGSYIRSYKEGKGILLKTKFFTLTLLWISIFYSTVFVVNIFFIQLVLLIIAVIVSLHVIRLPTMRALTSNGIHLIKE